MKTCIVTGSCGLVGSETVRFFANKGYRVVGIDNDMRNYFFNTTTNSVRDQLVSELKESYTHASLDIRNIADMEPIFSRYGSDIEAIVHCAAQPSHDWAAKEPLTDFGVNAVGTCNLLELTRKYCPKASFIYMSTNKVYGDTPNHLPLQELETRYEGPDIDETMSVDQCKHSIFGVSKLSADIMVQEYGRYFGMNTVVFRGGCITGPNHQGAQLHGFLSYLVKCIVQDKPYTIFGYKGKQVRDNIHSYDLANAFWHYHQSPTPGAVYNIGGGRGNAASVLESIDIINKLSGKNWKNYTYTPENRSGDHMFYISDLTRFKKQYPSWNISYSLENIIRQILQSQSKITITSQLKGGVGNQLFQIALAYATARDMNALMAFDTNGWVARQGSHPSKYYKSLYEKLTFKTTSLSAKITVSEKASQYYPATPILPANFEGVVNYDGYWQSDKHFSKYRNEIRDLFTPANGIVSYLETNTRIFEMYPELKNTNDYCFIGVRRGDYITYAEHHMPCGMTFYNTALSKTDNSRYYVLSDDIEWCKKKFIGYKFTFFDIKDDLEQLLVSTLFKTYIISNSSFYWWGSYLSVHGDDVTIYAPDKWCCPQYARTIYTDKMIVLERPVEID